MRVMLAFANRSVYELIQDAQDRNSWRTLIELRLQQAAATRTGQSGDR